MSRRSVQYESETIRPGKRFCSPVLLLAALALFMTTLACGIVIIPERTVYEEPFKKDQVMTIRNNVTTKQGILDWFGPPLVVTRPSTTVRMPERELYNALGVDVPSDTLFARFKPGSPPPRSPLLYYYEDQALSWTSFGVVFFAPNGGSGGIVGPTGGKFKVVKLWILLDDATGLVVDHQIEEGEQNLTGQQIEGLVRVKWH